MTNACLRPLPGAIYFSTWSETKIAPTLSLLFIAENAKTEAELEKQRINAYRDVAVEYAKNQPHVVYRNVYRNIYWY